MGFPVAMLQKPQERVQTSPRIISVAVPAAQHSPMFGHLALWQTVCNCWSLTSLSSLENSSPPGIFILSQEGLRPRVGGGSVSWVRETGIWWEDGRESGRKLQMTR